MSTNAKFLNELFIKKIESPELLKQAEVNVTSFIRSRLREDSFLRQILTPQTIQPEQLTKCVETDKPMVVLEKEPDSQATWVPFRNDSPNTTYFTGPRYQVHFGMIESENFTKSIYELKTYDNDIRQILSDNAVKDLQEQEDSHLISAVDDIVAAAGSSQFMDFSSLGGLSKENYIESRKMLKKMKLPLGVSLMTQSTSEDILKWDSNDVGDVAATTQYEKGLVQSTLFGGKVIYTIKNDIVPDGTVYHFTTESFLGKLFFLADATVFIKNERDLISFNVHEVVGMGIGNTRGVVKAKFY